MRCAIWKPILQRIHELGQNSRILAYGGDSVRRLVGGLVALTFVLAGCGGASTSSNGKVSGTVNFGLPFGYTGNLSILGDSWLKGGRAAADIINKNGGVYGQSVNIIPVDTALDTIDAVPAIRKMLAVDDVKVSIGLAALDYTDALPIENQAKMVSFTIIGSPAMDHVSMPYSFSLRASDALEGAAMVVLAKEKGYHNIAVVFDGSATAQTFPPVIKFAADKLGLSIVAQPSVPESAPSYQAEISQVLQAHPDAVLMQIEPNQAGAFFDEWKTLGGTPIPIISTDLTAATTWTQAVGADEVTNHIIGVQALTDISGEAGTQFTSTFTSLYGQPPGYLAQYAYDGVTLAALAMIAAHSTDPSTYRQSVLDVTQSSSDHQVCYTFQTCVQLLNSGKKIKFWGVGSPFIYNQYHRTSGDFGAYLLPLGTTPIKLLEKIPATSLVGLY